MSKPPPCDYLDCPAGAGWEIYPRRHDPSLAVRLCDLHRSDALESKTPKQELYAAATALVRSSLKAHA